MVKRVEVVGYYPDSPYDVGDILTLYKSGLVYCAPEKYLVLKTEVEKSPLIFKPIPWYKYRKAEEMPEYLTYPETGEVIKVTNYEFWNNGCWYYQGRAFKPSGYFGVDGTLPADKEHYEAYLKTK